MKTKSIMHKGVDYIGVSVGALILNEKRQILLTQRSQNSRNEKGCWEAPGGSVDFGETLEEAVRREMREELGIDIQIIHQFPAENHLIPNEKQHWIATTFLCFLTSDQKPIIKELDKCDALGWFFLDKLPSPLSLITQADILKLKNYNLSLLPGTYQHYKGKKYQVLNVGKHSENLEEMVIYQALYDNPISQIWIRPKKMFLESIAKDNRKVKRFTKI